MHLITPLEKFYQFETEKAHQTFLRQAQNSQWIHFSWKRVGNDCTDRLQQWHRPGTLLDDRVDGRNQCSQSGAGHRRKHPD